MNDDSASFQNIDHALFQASMWRQYAADWSLHPEHGRRRFVEFMLKVSRAECLRIARHAVVSAKNMRLGITPPKETPRC